MMEQRSKGMIVTNADVKEQSLTIAARENMLNFKSSAGWVSNFKKRKNFRYRKPTHVGRKTHFSDQDMVRLGEFFEEIEDVVTAQQIPLSDIFNFDQTMIRLVAPHPKTNSPIGVKQVNVIHPPGEKDGITVALTVRADGYKYPAIIIFKGSKTTGLLSKNILNKLIVPDNVIIRSGRNSWWSEILDHDWIESTFGDCERDRVLIRDQFTVHKMDSSEMKLREMNVRQIFVPAAMTDKHQPLDVGVNRPFKVFYREPYHKWRKTHSDVTKSSYLKKPGRSDIIQFVSYAWRKVSLSCVRKSFVGAEIVSEAPAEDVPEVSEEGGEDENSFLDMSFYNEESFVELDDLDL